MPFGALDRQALGLSLLKQALSQNDIHCDVRYLNFPFADLIGYDLYQWISFQLPYTAFAGDWSFTGTLYGDRQSDEQYIQDILRNNWQLDQAAIDRILYVRSLASIFIDYCMSAISWQEYCMVGFTSTFEQNISSLSLARRIKAAFPHITIVFGGANWEGEMGLELHRQFGFVDYVCSGESENSFPSLVRMVLEGDAGKSVPGLVMRRNGESISTGPALNVRNMDELPIPDYSDYFRDLYQSGTSSQVLPNLLFESSRGCWWGAKHHCTFCGLNGGSMAFRSKSSQRALSEIYTLADRWNLEVIEAVDNILDMSYFQKFLPELAKSGRDLRIFYEVKSNLTRKHVELLYAAGVHRIQPGIESMSDHILKLMRKGTTALQNIQLLKWCKQYGISVDWNVLYGFPGETRMDYDDMLDLFQAIRFLDPPHACGPVRLDRFSPYHENPAGFGMINVRPMATYKYLYQANPDQLARIAYYFDYEYENGNRASDVAVDVISYVEQWRERPEPGTLTSEIDDDNALLLMDTRSDAAISRCRLRGLEKFTYEFCDDLHSVAAVTRRLHDHFPRATIQEGNVKACLDSFVANKLMVSDGVNYLSLAIPEYKLPILRNDSQHSDGLRILQ